MMMGMMIIYIDDNDDLWRWFIMLMIHDVDDIFP